MEFWTLKGALQSLSNNQSVTFPPASLSVNDFSKRNFPAFIKRVLAYAYCIKKVLFVCTQPGMLFVSFSPLLNSPDSYFSISFFQSAFLLVFHIKPHFSHFSYATANHQTVHLPNTSLILPMSYRALGIFPILKLPLRWSNPPWKEANVFYEYFYITRLCTPIDWKANLLKAVNRAKSSWAAPRFMQVGPDLSVPLSWQQGGTEGQKSYCWNSGFTTSQIQHPFQNDRMHISLAQQQDKQTGRQSILILEAWEQTAYFSPI